mmetsp:Transcript_457/g.942  ORF Transcript_457/g.942 Transcript_457/m.942 type:complete len:619 (+) Transcript_457:44-1900(+)
MGVTPTERDTKLMGFDKVEGQVHAGGSASKIGATTSSSTLAAGPGSSVGASAGTTVTTAAPTSSTSASTSTSISSSTVSPATSQTPAPPAPPLSTKEQFKSLKSETEALRSILGDEEAAEYRQLRVKEAREFNAGNHERNFRFLSKAGPMRAPVVAQTQTPGAPSSLTSSALTEVSPQFLSQAVSNDMSGSLTNFAQAKQRKQNYQNKLAEAKTNLGTAGKIKREVKPVYQRALHATFVEKFPFPPYGTAMIMAREATYTVSLFYLISKMENIFFENFPKPEKYVPTMQMVRDRFGSGAETSAGRALSLRGGHVEKKDTDLNAVVLEGGEEGGESRGLLSSLRGELETGLRGGGNVISAQTHTETAHAQDAALFPTASRSSYLGGLGSVGQIPAARLETEQQSPPPEGTGTHAAKATNPPEAVALQNVDVVLESSSSPAASSASSKMRRLYSSEAVDEDDEKEHDFMNNSTAAPPPSPRNPPLLIRERSMLYLKTAEQEIARERSKKGFGKSNDVQNSMTDLSDGEYKALLKYNLQKESFVVLASSAVFTGFSTAPMVVASYQQAYSMRFGEAVRKIWRYEGFKGFLKGLLPRWATLTGSILVVSNVINFFEVEEEED